MFVRLPDVIKLFYLVEVYLFTVSTTCVLRIPCNKRVCHTSNSTTVNNTAVIRLREHLEGVSDVNTLYHLTVFVFSRLKTLFSFYVDLHDSCKRCYNTVEKKEVKEKNI